MADSPPPAAISPPPAAISPPLPAISLPPAAISLPPAAISPPLTEILLNAVEIEATAAKAAAELESPGRSLLPTASPRRAVHSAADVAAEGPHSSAWARLLRSAERDESTDPSRRRLDRDERRRAIQTRFDSVRRIIIEAALDTDSSLRAPYCAVGVGSEDPGCVRRQIKLVEELASCRKKLLTETESSVSCGKYEDASHAINVVACLGWNLTSSEMSLFSVSNMTFISELKYSMMTLEANDLLFVKEEIRQWCYYVVQTIDTYLLPFSERYAAISYNHLKGYFWDKIAEIDNDSVALASSFASYESGFHLAAELCPTDLLRLRVTVDLIICLDTTLGCRIRAYKIAKEAWEAADSAM